PTSPPCRRAWYPRACRSRYARRQVRLSRNDSNAGLARPSPGIAQAHLDAAGWLDLTRSVVRDPIRTTARNEEPELPPNIFVIGLLHDLKAGNYSRQAWGAFIRASWVRSLQIIQENGELRSSWLRFAVAWITGLAIATVAVLLFCPD